MFKVISASIASYIIFSSTAFAATDFYDSRSRTISVSFEQPVQSVSVHITGKERGKCIPAKAKVHVMNFIPAQTVKKDKKLSVGLGLKSKKANAEAEIAASLAESATSETPAVYSFNYTGLIRELHYNIVYTRGGVQYALGWRPDSDGGCTYSIP